MNIHDSEIPVMLDDWNIYAKRYMTVRQLWMIWALNILMHSDYGRRMGLDRRLSCHRGKMHI